MHIKEMKFNTKPEMYKYISEISSAFLSECTTEMSLLSNTSAMLKEFLADVNWLGFYIMKDGKLTLGPFQGKPAVTIIDIGRGVCGTAVKDRETQLIENVHKCTNHIACDIASFSEIVVPIIIENEVYGVLDIDSPIEARFDEDDKAGLDEFVEILKTHISRLV